MKYTTYNFSLNNSCGSIDYPFLYVDAYMYDLTEDFHGPTIRPLRLLLRDGIERKGDIR